MPRLKPRRARWRDDQILVALEEIPSHDPNMMRPAAYRGQVFLGSHRLVKRDPHLFAEAPEPQGPPQPTEPYAVPVTHIRLADGRIIGPGDRFHPYDPVVLEHPCHFHSVIPNG